MSEAPEYSHTTFRLPSKGDSPLALGSRKGKVLLLLAGACVAAFLIASFLAADRSIVVDEGMYLANLHDSWRTYLEPLTHYNQASPPLVSIAYAEIIERADGNLRVLRLCIAAVFLSALAFFTWQVARAFRFPLAAVSVLLLLSNGFLVRYVTEIKHYGIEACVSLLLLAVYMRALRKEHTAGRAAAYGFAALALALSLASYTVLIVATTLMFDRALFSEDRRKVKHWWISLAIFLGVYGLLYLLFLKGLLFFNLTNFREEYEVYLLRNNLGSLEFWKHTLRILVELFRPPYLLGLVLVALALVAPFAWRQWATNRFAPARLTFILAGAILFLSAIGLYPLAYPRHLVFTLPFLALAVGWAAQELVDRYPRTAPVGVLFLGLFLAVLSGRNAMAAFSGEYDFERTRQLYSFARSHPETDMVMWYGFQPAYEFYERYDSRDGECQKVLGRIKSQSGLFPPMDQAIRDFSNAVHAASGWAATVHLRDIGRFDVYTDWLAAQIPANQSVLLPLGYHDQYRYTELMRSLGERNCVTRVVFEERGVKALRVECPDAR
jgi:MFS family permease